VALGHEWEHLGGGATGSDAGELDVEAEAVAIAQIEFSVVVA
jgi:hypothetical protein